MKSNTISLRRRNVMLAGVSGIAGAAAPAGAFAALCSADAAVATSTGAAAFRGGDKLIVSGRIVDAGCKPVAHATIEAWHADVHRTSVTTDGDGRFMFTTTTPARQRHIDYRVSHKDLGTRVKQLHLARERGLSDDAIATPQRDDAGVWRATFGLTIA
jgi:protocatechuate 3,4-dioxygenase beta subunit